MGMHQENEAGFSYSHRSHDELLPDSLYCPGPQPQPQRLNPDSPYRPAPQPQPQRPDPDVTSASNSNVVYSFLSMPLGTQGPSQSQPMREQNRQTEEDLTDYATLRFVDQVKNRSGPERKSPKNDVYAKVAKPQEQKKKKQESQEEYENIRGAHAAQYPIPLDLDEDVQINYSVVSFKKRPGHDRPHRGPHHSSDEEDHKTEYSAVKI